ncbi:MAG: caspase family protein, partial [Terrimicrobiaceae bacterium]
MRKKSRFAGERRSGKYASIFMDMKICGRHHFWNSRSLWSVVMILLAVLSLVPARAETRTALVIGNDRYESAAGALRNSVNDARAVSRVLRQLDFTVIECHDVTRDQLLKGLTDFRKTLSGAEVGIFYYAGHGLSVAGANYLVPIKSGFQSAGADEVSLRLQAETKLLNAEQIVADMNTAGAGCNLIILDACRNTPLARRTSSRSFAARGGLAEMTPPAGSLIAFAT